MTKLDEMVTTASLKKVYASGEAQLSKLTQLLNREEIRWDLVEEKDPCIKVWDPELNKLRYIQASKDTLVID